MNRAGWENVVESMKGNGAVGTDEQFKEVIDYLAKNFPRQ
jgi:competence protein ComEA